MTALPKDKRVALVILDGFGVATPSRGNAIFQAGTPMLDDLVQHYPACTLQASGPLVGLPWGEMGNSEVGHLNISAGRIVAQDLGRINTAIQSGEFFRNPELVKACQLARSKGAALHVMGLCSNGGVHASLEHLYALLALAKDQGVARVCIHMFLDGRDTAEKVALEDLQKLRIKIQEIGIGEIATVAGRFYAMDRGGHWEQTAQMFRAMVNGQGRQAASAEAAIESSYEQGIYDEMIAPTVIMTAGGKPVGQVSEGDSVVHMNFRQDRALQLTRLFVESGTTPLAGKVTVPASLHFVTMAEYRENLPVSVAFAPQTLDGNLAEVIASQGLAQFHVAESEKYAHVTVFFNCGRTEPLPGEKRKIVSSPSDNFNYDEHPEMSAPEITEELLEQIQKNEVNFLVANFANGDMVGHTGNLEAAKIAVRCLDDCMGQIATACLRAGVVLLITADHGNIEQLISPRTGEIDKDHTTNPVPLILVSQAGYRPSPVRRPGYLALANSIPEGAISDIAPTVLELFGIKKSPEMTAVSLLPTLQ